MIPPAPRLTREEEALAEIAATRVTRAGAWALVTLLFALLVVGSLLEGSRFARGEKTAFAGGPPIPSPRELAQRWRSSGPLAAHRELREGLLGLEDRLGRESALSAALRPAAQTLLARHLDYGNSQVVVGQEDWLYFRTEFDYLTGEPFLDPHELARRRILGHRYFVEEPDPIPGLLQLRDELSRRGVELVFFPVPVKAQVHPQPLVRLGRISGKTALTNPSFPELVRRLEAAGLPVYDALPELSAAAAAGEQLYFASDTHWNSAGMRIAAEGLAKFLARATALPPHPPAGLRRIPYALDTAHESGAGTPPGQRGPTYLQGDLNRLLGNGIRGPIFPDELLQLDEIVGLGSVPFAAQSVAQSDLLLLGDSYMLIHSALAGGRTAGFPEHVAYALDRPVRRAAKVASNSLADRVIWLRQDPSLLDGVRVVVYEVTARAFSSSDWTGSAIQPPSHDRSEP